MGVETDFVLARPSQAQAVLASHNPAQDFGGVYAKGADPISLGSLLTVLTSEGSPKDPTDIFSEYHMVASGRGGEKLISAVPDRLRTALAALPEHRILEVAHQWMETLEFKLTGWDEEIAVDFIRGIKALLPSERADDRELWMVISV